VPTENASPRINSAKLVVMTVMDRFMVFLPGCKT
jgi:hypothetical protein